MALNGSGRAAGTEGKDQVKINIQDQDQDQVMKAPDNEAIPSEENIKSSRRDQPADSTPLTVSQRLDLFLSPNGQLPRVSMLVNLSYVLLASILAAGAVSVVNCMLIQDERFGFFTKRWIRVFTIATVYILSSLWIILKQKIPSGIVPLIGGIHAVLMKTDYSMAMVACGMEAGIAAVLIAKYKGSSHMVPEMAVWALYTSLICLSLPTLRSLGDGHQPSVLALIAMPVVGVILNHPILPSVLWIVLCVPLYFWD